jgi:two-component system, OmpR family, alkaline phosphatase synthesis response regulator PhoP
VSVRRPKVAVIDDSQVVLEVAKGALESAGYEVVTHDKSAGCVAFILHEKPDLVLMDVNMPGLAGDTVASVLAKAQPTAETIVLLHSSLSAEVLRVKAASAGAHGYIQKSGELFALVREVNRWLKRLNSSGHMRAARAMSGDDARSSGTRPAAAPSASSSAESSSSLASNSGGSRGSGTLRLEPPKVLLVDDDMSILSGYRRQLQAEDIAVEFALSGTQALRRLLSETPPDAVVCDMLLPDISGVDVYRRALAAEPSYGQRFAVATGAWAVPAVASFLASFTGPVLHKPIDSARLVRAVHTCLSGARAFSKSSARR